MGNAFFNMLLTPLLCPCMRVLCDMLSPVAESEGMGNKVSGTCLQGLALFFSPPRMTVLRTRYRRRANSDIWHKRLRSFRLLLLSDIRLRALNSNPSSLSQSSFELTNPFFGCHHHHFPLSFHLSSPPPPEIEPNLSSARKEEPETRRNI